MAKIAKYVGNKSELAMRLRVNPRTLDRLFTLSDHPTNRGFGAARYNVAEWTRFAALNTSAHNRKLVKPPNGSNGELPSSKREQSIIRKNEIAAERDTWKLEKEKRNWWPIEEVNRAIDAANTVVMRSLTKWLGEEAPPRQAGMSAAELKKYNIRRLNEILADLPKKLANAEGEVK
ncbi:MAG: hypothetical protein M3Y27_23560 [Acidobacteriota bacterium]|nr:hypothetical protein [Acidobacteriota bacterium]